MGALGTRDVRNERRLEKTWGGPNSWPPLWGMNMTRAPFVFSRSQSQFAV